MRNPMAMEVNYGLWNSGFENRAQINTAPSGVEEFLDRYELKNLVDVLFATKVSRIGDPIVVEESNRHLIVKIICRERMTPERDSFIREFFTAALRKTGKYPDVKVIVLYHGPFWDNFLILKANW